MHTFFHKLALFEMFVGLKFLNFGSSNAVQERHVHFLEGFQVQIYQHLSFYFLVVVCCRNQYKEFPFQIMDLLYSPNSQYFSDRLISSIFQEM